MCDMQIKESVGYSDSYVKLTNKRVIFLSEDVTIKTASDLSALLLYYDNISDEDITLYINTGGGDVSALSHIYDVMQLVRSQIKTICIGRCYSAGAFILSAGAKGKRYAFKNSKIMIHGIQFGFPLPGQDIMNSKNYYEFIKENNDILMKILARHTGHTLEKIKIDCKEDVFMTPQQAVDYGLIDVIL
jgi:ATP-dependent Clp protease protease subunit